MRWRWIPPSIWRRPEFAELVKERTNGAIEINVFPEQRARHRPAGAQPAARRNHRDRAVRVDHLQRPCRRDGGARNAVPLPRRRPCLPRARRQGRPEPARQAGPVRHSRTRLPRERLAPGDQQPASGSLGRGHQGPEDPHHAQPLSHPGLPAPGREPGAVGLRRALFRARDRRRRRAGAPAADPVGGEVLRGPEVSHASPAMPTPPSSS